MKALFLKVFFLAALLTTTAAAGWNPFASSAPALDDFTRYIFVPSRASATVSVIDSKTDQLVTALDVGVIPGQIVVSEAEAKLVASNVKGKSLIVIDLISRKRLPDLPLQITPDHMQLSPDGYLLAIGDVTAGKVAVVSLNQGRILSTIDGLSEPYNFTFSADASLIYVANLAARHVSVISPSQQRVIYDIPLTDTASRGSDFTGVTNVTRTPNDRYGFATVTGGDFLHVLNLDSGKPIKMVPLGKDPWRAYATVDGRMILVPNNGARTVSVIDATSLDVMATLPGASDVTAVNTGWFDSVAFVISHGEHKVVVLDLMELKPAGEISLPGAPGPGVVIPDGRKLYLALETGKVAVIDTRERKMVALIEGLDAGLWGATMGRSNNYCH